MSMVGALLQFIQVMGGVAIPQVTLTAGWLHGLIVAGTLALLAGFATMEATWFHMAIISLLGGFSLLLVVCWLGFRRSGSQNATFRAIRLALIALGVTAGFGAMAGAVAAGDVILPFERLVNLHAAWGLLGWVCLLIVGVAYQVVPMFQMTPSYPAWATRIFAPAIFAALCIWSIIGILLPNSWLTTLLAMVIGVGLTAFAGLTLDLLRQRKRRRPDPTTLFWLLGLASMLGAVGMYVAGNMFPEISASPTHVLQIGILIIVGFAFSVINGMLYKIVPFLVWYHLQNRMGQTGRKPPNVKQIISDSTATGQCCAHLVALTLLLVASIFPQQLTRFAAVVFIASSFWLWANVASATGIYLKNSK